MAGFIAEIIDKSSGELVGMGILVASDRVLTCAHVVNAALEREIDESARPDGEAQVRLRFPFDDNNPRRGTVRHWNSPTGGQEFDDICILSLNSPLGAEVEPAQFAKATHGQLFQAPRSTGLDSPLGWAPGVVGNPSISGLYEVNSRPGAHEDDVIIPGCSGGPLIDEKTGHVLGMVVFANSRHKEAHCLPAQTLKRAYDRLKMAPRRRQGMTRRGWLLTGAGVVTAGAAAGGAWWWMTRKPTMRIGIKPFVGYAPLIVAEKLKLIETADIEFVTVEDVAQMKDLVKAGELDAGLWLSCTHGLFRSERTPVKAKAVLKLDESKDGDAIVVKPRIETIADLKGRKIAFQKHDAGDYLLRSLCKKANVSFELLNMSHTNPREAAQGFIDGKYDAVTTYEPFLTNIREKTGITPKWTAKNLGEFGIVDILAVREDYLAANEGAIQGLIAGWYAAVSLLQKSDRQAVEIAVKFLRTSETPRYNAENLKQDIDPNVIELADKAANRRFFRITGGESVFSRHYANGIKVFGPDAFNPIPFSESDVPDRFHPYESA